QERADLLGVEVYPPPACGIDHRAEPRAGTEGVAFFEIGVRADRALEARIGQHPARDGPRAADTAFRSRRERLGAAFRERALPAGGQPPGARLEEIVARQQR